MLCMFLTKKNSTAQILASLLKAQISPPHTQCPAVPTRIPRSHLDVRGLILNLNYKKLIYENKIFMQIYTQVYLYVKRYEKKFFFLNI